MHYVDAMRPQTMDSFQHVSINLQLLIIYAYSKKYNIYE